jgi:uncharacterized glyoxalase superfamily protein PhnB
MLERMSDNVTCVIAILPSADLEKSMAWWVAQCGFQERFRYGAPMFYAGIERGGASLHLNHFPDAALAKVVAEQTVVRLMVEDAEAMHAEFVERGGTVHPNGRLAVKPWGTKEFSTIDPAGVLVWFQQNVER